MAPELKLAARPLKPPIGRFTMSFWAPRSKISTTFDKDCAQHCKTREPQCTCRSIGTALRLTLSQPALEMLEKSSGYLGIFGFYYGWIPDGSQCSITELECHWARQRWHAVHPPPIFVFLPEVASAAEQELLAKAEQALLVRFPGDVGKREEHKRRQTQFRESICNSGNIVIYFKNTQLLMEQAISAILLWNQELLERAWRREVGANYLIPQHELGEIGRKPQLHALEDLIISRDERDDAPALCAIAYGPSNCGLGAFSACLARWHGWQDLARDIEPGRPPRQPYTITTLIRWAISNLGPSPVSSEVTVDDLAETIAGRLEDGPEVLLLRDLDSLQGGLTSFAGFWSKLNAALCKRWKRGAYRFSMVVMTNTRPEMDDPVICQGDPWHADYSRLLLLPTLAPLTQQDVERWLDKHCVLQAHRIAENVIKRSNGIALEVYDQLNTAEIWRQVIERRT